MPTRNVSLTKELDQFIASKVEAGLYANASEEFEEKMAVLRAAIAEGDASGDAEEGVFERLFAYIDELAEGKDGAIA